MDAVSVNRPEKHGPGGENFTIRLAGCAIAVTALFASTREFCIEYLTNDPPDFSVQVSIADLAYEQERSARENEAEGMAVRRFSDEYLETLAVYRKIAEKIVDYDILLFHGSVVAVDGIGYLFTAKSGTGKSTHTRLWREQFGDRAVMVNDDKPLLKITDHGVIACGTPWDGKHHLSNNIAVPLRAICILERSVTNHIEPVTPKDAYAMLMQQSYRPARPEALKNMLNLMDRLTGSVSLYRLGCNMEREAAQTAYEGMNERKETT